MRHKYTLLLACACAFTALAGASTLRADTGEPEPPATTTEEAPAVDLTPVRHAIQRLRHETWHWQRIMGRPLTRELQNAPADPRPRLELWRRLAARVRHSAQNPPHKIGRASCRERV